ncbi:hypothetical protein AB8O64_35415 (plasmid) [Streptomyces sp. QH1-20]|uniref:hypothetical protein n=1 Tax=Streptomyces sp. QH1-20 TaxID=3240934 RepID=UPI0035141145
MLKALGIFQRATADQLWRMLRPGDRHDRCTRDTLNALKKQGKVRVETRLKSGHQLWVLTEHGHKEARLLLPKHMRISALRKLEYGTDGEPVAGDGYDEHAAAVTLTAAVLTGAGLGTPLSWQTEIGHKLPYFDPASAARGVGLLQPLGHAALHSLQLQEQDRRHPVEGDPDVARGLPPVPDTLGLPPAEEELQGGLQPGPVRWRRRPYEAPGNHHRRGGVHVRGAGQDRRGGEVLR